jgi:positive regulator of sigma E activity
MKFIEEIGTVVSIRGTKAIVRLDENERHKCDACCACAAFASGEHTIRVPAGEFKEGDRVAVHIPQINSYLNMFLVFGLPLVLFLAGGIVGHAIEGTKEIGGLTLLAASVGFALAFVISGSINNRLWKHVTCRVQPPPDKKP